MTYAEVKAKIRDLGFEDDATMEEYKDIVTNSVNRSLDMIFYDIEKPNKGYFVNDLSKWSTKVVDGITEEVITKEYKVTAPEHVTNATEATFEIELPDELVYLLPILASYFIWLDDDVQKANAYYNLYLQEKNDFEQRVRGRNNKVIMTGGLWF